MYVDQMLLLVRKIDKRTLYNFIRFVVLHLEDRLLNNLKVIFIIIYYV